MSDDLYIWVRNWGKFQHYKNRNPAWIKSYTELLHDETYLRLTLHRRGLLHGLHLAMGLSRRCLPFDVEMLNRWLHSRAKMADYKALNHAGFIDFVDSKELAKRERAYSRALAQRLPREEKEKDRDKEKAFKQLAAAETRLNGPKALDRITPRLRRL